MQIYLLMPSDVCCTGQARAQSQLLGQLLPMVAQLPSAQARCKALARIWAAAVASDLETRRAVRTRQKTLPGAELKQLLSDAFVMEVVSGSAEGAHAHAPIAKPYRWVLPCRVACKAATYYFWRQRGGYEIRTKLCILAFIGSEESVYAGAKDATAPDAHYPAFREELVCALLETLITHPRAEAASQAPAAPEQQQESTVADAMQALSLQQTPPATPGEYHNPARAALEVPYCHFGACCHTTSTALPQAQHI